MTQLLVAIDSNRALPRLKRAIESMQGVVSASVVRESKSRHQSLPPKFLSPGIRRIMGCVSVPHSTEDGRLSYILGK